MACRAAALTTPDGLIKVWSPRRRLALPDVSHLEPAAASDCIKKPHFLLFLGSVTLSSEPSVISGIQTFPQT